MRYLVDLNVDMGESYGRWRLGEDAEVMPFITSANVACGFHAGDPTTIRQTVRLALAHGVAIGAHVGFPDLLGFGRRRLAASAEEVRDYATYQLGALSAFATAEGATLSHVKAHGALYALCGEQEEYASALARAVAGVDAGLPVLLSRSGVRAAVEAEGVRFVLEAFPDLDYRADGSLVIEQVKQSRDPETVARRAVHLVREHQIDTVEGGALAIEAVTLCLHGDAPEAAATARAVRAALEAAGVTVSRGAIG